MVGYKVKGAVLNRRLKNGYTHSMSNAKTTCPCGSGRDYSACCEPIIKGTSLAVTAEELMRARYSAYEKQEIDFIINTCEANGDKTDNDDADEEPDDTKTDKKQRKKLFAALSDFFGIAPLDGADSEW